MHNLKKRKGEDTMKATHKLNSKKRIDLKHVGPLVLAVALSTSITPAKAESLSDWLNQPTMMGDWNGARTRLKNDGITFNINYDVETASVLSGGERQGSDQVESVYLGTDFDLDKIAGVQGGTLHLTFLQRWGRSASADFIGSKLAVQENFGGGENLRLYQMSYEQYLAKNTVNAKVGFIPLGDDFDYGGPVCTFMANGFCGHMQALPFSSSGFSDGPIAHWGGRLRVYPTQNSYIVTGIYDVNPTTGTHQTGLDISLAGSTGVIFPVEFGYTTSIGPSGLLGHYKIGGYYDTSTVADVLNTGEQDGGRYGGWVYADQMLCSFGPASESASAVAARNSLGYNDFAGERGIIAFVGGSLTDSRTSDVPNYIMAGLVVQGLMNSRPNDYMNIGVVRAGLNQRLIDAQSIKLSNEGITDFELQTGESDVEIGYGLQATPWLLIHPNFQYVGDPGAFSFKQIPNAWVSGLEAKVTF
jgi:porin